VPKPTTTEPEQRTKQGGQRAALFLAGVGVFWVVATWAGGALDLSMRVRALFDLIALAGFGWALWMTYQVWRDRQDDKG
jgi:threonine/homoserine/homoserine lactone efflux protein